MPKRLFEQASVTLNGFDISGDVSGLDLMVGRRSPVDVTGLSDTFDQYLVPNIRKFSVKLNYFNNFDGTSITPTGIATVLRGIYLSSQTSGVPLIIRATTAARGPQNPEWQSQVQLDGDFAGMSGGVAEADKGSVGLKGLSNLSWFTSSS